MELESKIRNILQLDIQHPRGGGHARGDRARQRDLRRARLSAFQYFKVFCFSRA